MADDTDDKTAIGRVDYDGFEGTVQGRYTTREGKPGLVLQQVGTKVVHVYREDRVELSSTPAQPAGDVEALANELEYRVDNPSAWERFDVGASELMRKTATTLRSLSARLAVMERERDEAKSQISRLLNVLESAKSFVDDYYEPAYDYDLKHEIEATLASVADPFPEGERKAAWASLRMIRDAIGEMFGPSASLASEEGVLHRGPEYHHEAEAIIAALGNVGLAISACAADRASLKEALERAPDQRHFNILVEAMAEVKATSDGASDQPIADIVAGCLAEIEAWGRARSLTGRAEG